MAKMKLNRPKKEMMLAINASIDGNDQEVNRLVNEFKLDRKELQARLEKRNGEQYDLEAGKGPRRPRVASRASDDILATVDGRTKISSLLRLESRIKEVLAQKDKSEVAKVRDTLNNIEKKRRELEEMEALIA